MVPTESGQKQACKPCDINGNLEQAHYVTVAQIQEERQGGVQQCLALQSSLDIAHDLGNTRPRVT